MRAMPSGGVKFFGGPLAGVDEEHLAPSGLRRGSLLPRPEARFFRRLIADWLQAPRVPPNFWRFPGFRRVFGVRATERPQRSEILRKIFSKIVSPRELAAGWVGMNAWPGKSRSQKPPRFSLWRAGGSTQNRSVRAPGRAEHKLKPKPLPPVKHRARQKNAEPAPVGHLAERSKNPKPLRLALQPAAAPNAENRPERSQDRSGDQNQNASSAPGRRQPPLHR